MSAVPTIVRSGLLMLLMFACAPGQTPPVNKEPKQGADKLREFLGLAPPPDPAAAERGSKVYARNCTFCHGAKATGGDTGPDLLRSALVLHDREGELIGPVLHGGRVEKGMPKFESLTSSEIVDIAAFLHWRVDLAANRGTYKVADLVTGDAQAGRAWFEGDGGCQSCHSVAGDLAHIGSRYNAPDLQARLLYPDSKSQQAKHVIVVLSSGRRFEGELKHLDDFRVSLIDAQGAYQSVTIDDSVSVAVDDPLRRHRELLPKYTDQTMHDVTAYLAGLK